MGSAVSSKASTVAADSAKSQPSTTQAPAKHFRATGNQALLRLQRKCACGGAGTCSECDQKKGVRIQTKVKVGPANDPFEQEADRVAETVMRMPANEPASAAGVHIQRSCSACQEEDERGMIRRHAIGREGGNAEGLSHGGLTEGGSALQPGVRGFFETRFGRDFSSVRVHTGSESHALNAGLNSHAFTYGSHIWLASGHSEGPSPLLAHELAHVVQQSGSPAIGGASDREGAVRRAITNFWYFEPAGETGTRTHSKVLPELQQQNSGLLQEIPSPISNDSLEVYDKKGRADLYMPSPRAAVGIYIKAHDQPANLEPVDGVPRAPLYSPTRALKNMNKAPAEVQVGDLKPIGPPSHAGVEQVRNYINGLKMVALHVRQGFTRMPSDGTWNPGQDYAKPLTNLEIPPRYTPPRYAGVKARELVLKNAVLVGNRVKVLKELELPRVSGHLAVEKDPDFGKDGIYNHYWVPITLPDAALPEDLRALDEETRTRIIPSLARTPVGGQRKMRHDPAPVVRRRWGAPKGINVKDPFNYDTWIQDVESVRSRLKTAEKNKKTEQSMETVEGTEAAVKDLKRHSAGAHLNVPKDAAGLRRLKFWTGPAAHIIGRFRQLFGGAFSSIARFILWGREKFRTFMQNHQGDPANAPGGAVGAIVRIIFKVAKFALMTMMPQIADRLWESLTTGVKNKLKSLIPDTIAEEYEARKEEFEGVMATLASLVDFDVLTWLNQLVDPIKSVLTKVGDAITVLKDVKQIVDAIKTAMRVINCAAVVEGNVGGCVLSLVGSVADFLIQQLVKNCGVQKSIMSSFVNMDIIRKTAPNWIADHLLDFGRKLLPKGWEGILAEPSKSQYFASTSDIPCEEKRTPMQIAMDELSQVLGDDEAKIFALSELMNALGGDELNGLDPSQVIEVGNLIRTFDITAEQMHNWARNIATPPKDLPEGFRQSMAQFFRSIAAGDKAPTQFDTGVSGQGADGGGGTGTGGGAGDAKGAGAGGTKATGAGGGVVDKGDSSTEASQITTLPASAVTWTGAEPGKVHDAQVEVVGGASASQTEGQMVQLSLYGERKSKGILAVLTEVSAKVTKVKVEKGKVTSITYELQQGVTFDLKGVAAAQKAGQPLGCFRLCLAKGRTRKVQF